MGIDDSIMSGEFGIGIEEMSDVDSDIESKINHSADEEFDPGCSSFDPWDKPKSGP
jgi:hypothetical protein